MTHASELFKRVGGPGVIARWLGVTANAVQRWGYEPPQGTSGRIPAKHWAQLISKAAENGHVITLEDLIPDDVAKAASRRRVRDRAA